MPVGFLKFGADHPDIIDQFPATSASDMGSMTVSAGVTFDSSGVFTGVENSGESIKWFNAFISPFAFQTNGFTLQFEIEKAAMAAVLSGFTQNRDLLFATAANSLRVTRHQSQNNWRHSAGGFTNGAKSINDSYRDRVIVTMSFDPSIGANGTQTLYFDYFLMLSDALANPVNFSGDMFVLGKGDATSGAIGFKAKNFMLSKAPTTLTGVNEKVIAVVGDSFPKYGQYQLGGDSNNTGAVILGEQVEQYADTSIKALNPYKNRCNFAELTFQLIDQLDIYPKNNRIEFYARGGTQGLASAGRPYSERIDAVLASTGATGPPFPDPGQGVNAVDIWFSTVGTNDASAGNTPATVLTDVKVEIDRMVVDGAQAVVWGNIARRFATGPGAEIDVAAVLALNEVFDTLAGYRDVTVVANKYDSWTSALVEGGEDPAIHPNADGQVLWAQIDVAALKAFLSPVTGSRGIVSSFIK